MKKSITLLAVISIAFITSLSCNKQQELSVENTESNASLTSQSSSTHRGYDRNRIIADLVASPKFQLFTSKFVLHMYDHGMRFQPVTGITHDDFTNDLSACDTTEASASAIYMAYGLDFDQMVVDKNIIDNDIRDLLNTEFDLADVAATADDTTTWNIIADAIDLGIASNNTEWEVVADSVTAGMVGRYALGTVGTLSLSEVWGMHKKCCRS